MKIQFLFVLFFSLNAHANDLCESRAEQHISLDDHQISRLCNNAVDDGPVRCFLNTPVRLSESLAVTLCKGARVNNSEQPIHCYQTTLLSLSEAASTLACSGARNSEPAKCANAVKREVLNGKLKMTETQIGFVCRHSIHAEQTLRAIDSLVEGRTLTSESLKKINQFNEQNYF